MKSSAERDLRIELEGDAASVGSVPQVWDQAASTYDAGRQKDAVYLSCLRQVLAPLQGRQSRLCLDAGCGTGLSTAEAIRHCERVVAVDYSRESLQVLRRKDFADQVWAVQADLTRLPFRDGIFPAVICANALQHLRPGRPQRQAVAELGRVTAANGLLAVSVHHFSRAKAKAGWTKEGKPGEAGIDYIFRFTRQELSALLPGALIRAVGFYRLARLPWLGKRLQDAAASFLGGWGARIGLGHMLIGVRQRRDPDPV